MSLALFVYFASIVSNISVFTFVFGVILLMGATFIYLDAITQHDGSYKYGHVSALCGMFLLLIATLTPSEKAMYTIAGAYLVQSAYQSETGDKIVRLINSKIDEQLSKIEKMQPTVPAK